MHTTLLLAFFTLAAPLQEPAVPTTATIRGTVVSETTGAPLPFAVVELLGVPDPVLVIADRTGSYVLEGVPAGRLRLRASYVDHAPLEVELLIPSGGGVALGFALEIEPIVLPPLEAVAVPRGGVTDSTAAPEPALTAAAVHALEVTPGMAELGLGAMGGNGGTEPPGHPPADPSDVLFVRGATAYLKRVLLDGAPVYTPFHVGGVIAPFEPGLLSAATLHLGGAPARYDGGLSYILDLRTRAGRRDGLHVAAGMDLLAARARVEGPIADRGGFLLATRAVHPLAGAVLGGGAFPYEYADGLVRADFEVGDEAAIGATAFWNREGVALADLGSEAADASWGNTAASVRYEGPLAGATARLVAGVSGYQARLPIQRKSAVLTDGFVGQVRLAADFARPAGPIELRYGAAYERLWLRYDAWRRADASGESLARTKAAGELVGGYVDVDWRALPRLSLRGGIRADHFSLEDGIRLAPRLSATWLVSEQAALTLAAGRYHQYVRVSEPALVETASDEAVQLVRTPLTVAAASHLVLTLEQQLGEDIGLGLEGFYKRFDGIPATERTRARASGVDVWLRRTGAEITAWAGYSLAWIWSLSGHASTSEVFSGRQLLSAGLSGQLGSSSHFELGLAYGAGLPYTAIPTAAVRAEDAQLEASIPAMASVGSDALPRAPDEPYLRLDAEVSHTWTPHWRGVDFTVTPYLKVLNALDRRDALFYRFEPDQDAEPQPLGTLPVLPVLGVRWTF